MTNPMKVLAAALTAVAFLTTAGVALAQTPPQGGPGGEGHAGPGMLSGRPNFGPGPHGSTTRIWNGPGGMHGSSTPMHGELRGIPGTVTQVDANDFLMSTPGFGKSMSTTTFTVLLSGSTQFVKGGEMGMGSSSGSIPQPQTASLSDLAVGTHVVVMGKIATSTKTITADRVVIGGDRGPDAGQRRGAEGQGPRQGGILDFLKSLFGRHSLPGGTANGSTTPPVQPAGGGGAAIWNFLFGWMH